MFYRELPGTGFLDIPVIQVPWDRNTRPEDLTPHERLRRAKFNAKHGKPHMHKFHEQEVADLKRQIRRGPTRMQAILAFGGRRGRGTNGWFFQCHPYLRGWL